MIRTLEGRVVKLEQFRKQRAGYVVHVCDPRTEAELAEIDKARSEGRQIALMPHACRSIEEWASKYGGEALHIKTGVPRSRINR